MSLGDGDARHDQVVAAIEEHADKQRWQPGALAAVAALEHMKAGGRAAGRATVAVGADGAGAGVHQQQEDEAAAAADGGLKQPEEVDREEEDQELDGMLDQLYISGLNLEGLYAVLRRELTPPFRGRRQQGSGPNLGNLRRLLRSGADPNHEMALLSLMDRQTPLHACAAGGYVEAAQLLVEEGDAALHACSAGSNMPLHLAAAAGHASTVALLLRCGADPGAAAAGGGAGGWGALHCAAARGALEVTELLLTAGAPADALTSLDQTALHLACSMGHEAVAERLVVAVGGAAAAAAAATDARGMTASACARRAGHQRLAALVLPGVLNISTRTGVA
jgi:hypothetical protein